MDLTTSLAIESWILYALGVAVVICRLFARRIKLGHWKDLQLEDMLMVFALTNFTGVVISINEVAKNGSNYMPADIADNLTPPERAMAVYGSIMTFVLELFTLTALWTVKACLLLLYSRLTKGVLTVQHKIVRIATGYCVLTYVLTVLLFLCVWCRPIDQYWAVPVQEMQCATYYHHMIFATACNISSDMLLFAIPIPIIMKTRLPTKRKIILCCILGLGVFNVLASVLNRYYNFTYPNSYIFLYWYVAEVGISMFVGNLPLCWPLLRLALGLDRDTNDDPSSRQRYHSKTSRQKPSSSNPLDTKNWDKLDDAEYAIGGGGEEHRAGSDGGSQIELVLHGNQLSQQHTAAVTSGGKQGAIAKPPMTGPGAAPAGAPADMVAGIGPNGEIRVTTTVDIVSTD